VCAWRGHRAEAAPERQVLGVDLCCAAPRHVVEQKGKVALRSVGPRLEFKRVAVAALRFLEATQIAQCVAEMVLRGGQVRPKLSCLPVIALAILDATQFPQHIAEIAVGERVVRLDA